MLLNVWFPAAGVLTLLGGFLYGPVLGTIFVESAAVLGAVFTFEVSRYAASGWIQNNGVGILMDLTGKFPDADTYICFSSGCFR